MAMLFFCLVPAREYVLPEGFFAVIVVGTLASGDAGSVQHPAQKRSEFLR